MTSGTQWKHPSRDLLPFGYTEPGGPGGLSGSRWALPGEVGSLLSPKEADLRVTPLDRNGLRGTSKRHGQWAFRRDFQVSQMGRRWPAYIRG